MVFRGFGHGNCTNNFEWLTKLLTVTTDTLEYRVTFRLYRENSEELTF